MAMLPRWKFSLALLAMLCVFTGTAHGKDKATAWKPIEDALLRVNDAPVKEWGVYQTGKKLDPLLLLIGKRFFLIEIHDKQIFELDASKVEIKATDLLWDPAERPEKPLATSAWDTGEIGAATRIKAKMDEEGRVLDLQLPHALPPSTATPPRTPAHRRQ